MDNVSLYEKLKAKIFIKRYSLSLLFTALIGYWLRSYIINYIGMDIFNEFKDWINLLFIVIFATIFQFIDIWLGHLFIEGTIEIKGKMYQYKPPHKYFILHMAGNN